jgi:hypothetical protein
VSRLELPQSDWTQSGKPMATLQRTQITLDERQAVFRKLGRLQSIPVQATLLLLLEFMAAGWLAWLAATLVWSLVCLGLMNWGAARYIVAIPAAIVAAYAGIGIGFRLFWILDLMRAWRVRRATDEALWREVERGLRDKTSFVLALAQLAARGHDVNRVLPDVLDMLASPSGVVRPIGFDALRFIFLDEARAIPGYNPHASDARCRSDVDYLRQLLREEAEAAGRQK